ncbi:hypothetical protein ACIQUG_04955 [Ensifer sp. NPDC090286]|uniref:hypothetical protein n=1 Tax=Ensifer sp. NPDC090286 TaxID=3363991 RepID=UPI00383A8CFF
MTAALAVIWAAVRLATSASLCPFQLVVPFLGIFPAMVAARLTVAFSRPVRNTWQLLALSCICGFGTVAGFVGVYTLTTYFASWDPGGYAVPYAVLARYGPASDLLMFSVAGALMAGATLGLWLLRDRRVQRNGADGEPGGTAASMPSVVVAHEPYSRSRQSRADERYFWLSILIGPTVVFLPLILLEMIFGPETAPSASKLPWAMLRYYFGGTYAAAVSAALVLAFVSSRSRRSAWLVAVFIGLHVGAIFTLLFDYADDTTSNQALLLPFGGIVGALSAAICTAIWFPDRRGLGAQTAQQGASLRALMRALLIAGFVAPAAAALACCVFAVAAQMLGIAPQGLFNGGGQVGAAETWVLNYRVWAVVALMTMMLDQFLKDRAARPGVAIVILSLAAFLVGGAMAHSLSEDILRQIVPISAATFLGLGLTSVVAGLSAVVLIRRGPLREAANVESVAA